MITIFTRLRAQLDEGLGYVTYVFENLEFPKWDTKYVMVTRCPNWEHRALKVGEEGFLTYEEHIAGDSKWFDGKEFHPYRYNISQFIKFIAKPEEIKEDFIMT